MSQKEELLNKIRENTKEIQSYMNSLTRQMDRFIECMKKEDYEAAQQVMNTIHSTAHKLAQTPAFVSIDLTNLILYKKT
jgi:predicted translin family RNA/ssDNA-binding protein